MKYILQSSLVKFIYRYDSLNVGKHFFTLNLKHVLKISVDFDRIWVRYIL